jgi:hypothetical protein
VVDDVCNRIDGSVVVGRIEHGYLSATGHVAQLKAYSNPAKIIGATQQRFVTCTLAAFALGASHTHTKYFNITTCIMVPYDPLSNVPIGMRLTQPSTGATLTIRTKEMGLSPCRTRNTPTANEEHFSTNNNVEDRRER